MKNIVKISLLAFSFFLFTFSISYAGSKPFEGVITFSISYPDSDFDAQTLSVLPKTATMIIKDNMFKMNMNIPGGKQSNVFDLKDKSGYVLLDMMGQKLAIRTDAQAYKDESSNIETEVTFSDETKEIAGYECKKAIIKVTDKESGENYSMNVFYTDEIEMPYTNSSKPIFEDIPGVLFEFDIHNKQINLSFSAISVKEMKIKDEVFKFPKEYTIKTEEEIRKSFGM